MVPIMIYSLSRCSRRENFEAPLHRDTDRNSDVGITAVVQVTAVVGVCDVNVVIVIPAIPPVFRPRIHETDPITFILEARVTANNHEGESVDAEAMVPTKVSAVTIVGDAVAVVTAALLPVPMV
jgi:hypothetical protein